MKENGTAVRYVPGNAVLLRHGTRAVMLRLVADHGLVGETWSRLQGDASIDEVLELILGEGLRTVSEFALVERAGGAVRVILRGGFAAEVRRDGDVEPIRTEGIWVDRRIDGHGVLALTVDGGAAAGQQLPFEGGIVLADGVLFPLTESSRHEETVIAAPDEATDETAEPLAEQPVPAGAPAELEVEAGRDARADDVSAMPAPPAPPAGSPFAPRTPAAVSAPAVLDETPVPSGPAGYEENPMPAAPAEPEQAPVAEGDGEPPLSASGAEPFRGPEPRSAAEAFGSPEPRSAAEAFGSPEPRSAAEAFGSPEPEAAAQPQFGAFGQPARPRGVQAGRPVYGMQDGQYAPPPPPAFATGPQGPEQVQPEGIGAESGDGGFGAAAAGAGLGFGDVAFEADERQHGIGHEEEDEAPRPGGLFEATQPYQMDDEPEETQMTPAQSSQYHGPVMILPDGEEIELAIPVVVGRSPRVPEGMSEGEVLLVTMQDPDRDVSSTHLEARFDGQRLLVTDLGSTNGTDLCEPGQAVRLLQPHQATELHPGSHLMLAGSQKVTFEAR